MMQQQKCRQNYLPVPCLPLRLLLAEDQARDAHLVQLALRSCDVPLELRHVRNGRAALEYLRKPGVLRPDALLLDYDMPEMNGLDCLAELQTDPGLAGLPVVMLSAYGGVFERARARTLGALYFVHKPSDLLMLCAAIGNLLPQFYDWQHSNLQRCTGGRHA